MLDRRDLQIHDVRAAGALSANVEHVLTVRIEAVLFDFDHTLGIDNKLEETVLRDLTRRYCGAPMSDQDIAAALGRFRRGFEPLGAMLANALEGCACGDDVLHEYKAAALRLLPQRLCASPGVAMTVADLKARGVVVAILTNGWSELQLAKAAGIGFDGPVFVSESIGAWKPDARAFRIATDSLAVPAERSAYVGDSPFTDVAGSKNVGMISVWADLEARTYPADGVEPDYSITSLSQILELPFV